MTVNRPWLDEANCRGTDTEAFFQDGGPSTDNLTAKRVCAACPVQAECLDWGLRHEIYGIWGGLSAYERKLERKRQRIIVQQVDVSVYLRGARRQAGAA